MPTTSVGAHKYIQGNNHAKNIMLMMMDLSKKVNYDMYHAISTELFAIWETIG